MFQAQRAKYLAGYITNYFATPLHSPYAYPDLFSTLLPGLLVMEAQLTAGTLGADIAGLRINQYVHSYLTLFTYLERKNLRRDLKHYTAIAGGDPNIWNSLLGT